MQVVEVTQERASRLPFRSRYPTAKLIAWMLAEAGLLRPFQPIRVIDITFGQGVFWHALRSKVVVAGVDVRRLDWAVRPRCFIEQPAQRWKKWLQEALDCLGGRVDLVVVDPPSQEWRRGREVGGRYHYRASRALGRPEGILEAGLGLARELGVPLLYHWKEPLGREHIVGPVAFRPFFHLLNQRAARYRSYFGVLA